jgi:predicted metalloenzyme YecM
MSEYNSSNEDMKLLSDIVGDYETFLSEILSKVSRSGFDQTDFTQLDVLCYRTATEESYQEKKRELEKVGTLLSEEIVSGHPIVAYRFHEPIYFKKMAH